MWSQREKKRADKQIYGEEVGEWQKLGVKGAEVGGMGGFLLILILNLPSGSLSLSLSHPYFLSLISHPFIHSSVGESERTNSPLAHRSQGLQRSVSTTHISDSAACHHNRGERQRLGGRALRGKKERLLL